jgi:lipase ATG15
MPAARLGLPTPPGYHLGAHQQRPITGGFHFGHTADSIFMGQCNTLTSVCTIGGYAMQSVCHTGQTCVYDTVKDFGWRVGATSHGILGVIKDVLEKYNETAACEPMVDCTDCFNWEFYQSNHSNTTTSKLSSTSSATRTSTCQTPGWWGCLDKTTTATTTTKTTTTTTCHTPGWFGCKDKTSDEKGTSISTSRTRETTTSSTPNTCEHPGWLGCRDPHTTAPSPSPIHSVTVPPETSTQKSTPSPTSHSSICTERSWLGRCSKWNVIQDVKLDL